MEVEVKCTRLPRAVHLSRHHHVAWLRKKRVRYSGAVIVYGNGMVASGRMRGTMRIQIELAIRSRLRANAAFGIDVISARDYGAWSERLRVCWKTSTWRLSPGHTPASTLLLPV